ncbi:zinc finger protein 808 [Culex quinquefasciatus]|uniref:zinc finger protein 808 n=1 Tax=Culex quinquefasciatus TaxID=7176 RepID=UPI0018E2C5B4|nr:zinc finger protein 808 [Culex quinquefasciatus]
MEVNESLEMVESKHDFNQDPEDDEILPPEVSPPRHPFQCEICDRILTTKQSLQVHKRTHADPVIRPMFGCEICGTTFKSRTGLSYHLETKHIPENERKKLPCPTCGRIFKSDEGRKIHMTIQHGVGGPIFRCKECPMVFARKHHLDLHMATHGAGQHVCTICGKSFARLKGLSQHEAICGGVMELCCPLCGKQLRSEQALENHRKKCRSSGLRGEVGDGEKRGRPKKSGSGGEEGKVRMRRSKHDRFLGLEHLADPSALVEAVVDPAKVEPKPVDPYPKRFPCEHCPLDFASKQAMQYHAQQQHWQVMGLVDPAERRIRCVHCPYKCYRKQELQKHERRKHWDVLGLAKPTILKRGRKKTRKEVDYVELEGLPAEVECDVKNEEVDPVKLEDTFAEAKNESYEPTPDGFAANEVFIKDEMVEFANDFDLDYFENDSTDGDELVEKPTFESIAADVDNLQEPTKEEVDTLDVEPALEEEPRVFKELVIKLEKLDYFALVKSSSCEKRVKRSKTTPASSYRCEECDRSYNHKGNFKAHNEKVHGITEEADEGALTRSCKHCDKRFRNWTQQLRHTKLLHGETIDESQFVQCPACFAKFFNQEDMKEHDCPRSSERMALRPFKCDRCDKSYALLTQLEGHYPIHPEYQNFKCDMCPKAFFKESTLKSHKGYKHGPRTNIIRKFRSKAKLNKPFPRKECEHCGQTFAHQYHLAQHRVKEHGSTEIPVANRPVPRTTLPRNFHCDQCDKSFYYESYFAAHKAKVHGVGEAPPQYYRKQFPMHTCKHCQNKFTSWGALIYHRKHIHGESIEKTQFVKCASCQLKFASEEEMANHVCLRGIIRERERPFKCDLCDKAFPVKTHLEIHYSVHPEYHNFKCDECPRGFYFERELDKHKKKVHISTESYHTCETCNLRFKTKGNLVRHQEFHMGRVYCCEHCGKEFQARHSLKTHMYYAHAEYGSEAARAARAIPCKICGKTLAGTSSLKLHMEIHTNERQFKCSFPSCGKLFLRRTCVRVHEQSHTKDYRFKCKFCDYGTVHRKTILLHEQREHNYNRLVEGNDS